MTKSLSEMSEEELWQLFPNLRYLGDWNELYFRDYLVAHPEIAEKYGELKKSLASDFKHNRDGYTEAKTEFINKWTSKARKELKQKYLPED